MYKGVRTVARPPQVVRLPLWRPLSAFNGATPTSLPICPCVSWPSSGKAAIRLAWVQIPTPLKPLSKASFAAKCSCSMPPMSLSITTIWRSSTFNTALILGCCERWVMGKRLASATRMPMSWVRRTNKACNATWLASGSFINSRSRCADWCSVRAKCDNTRASMASVLARYPIALAKSRACRGLTTITASPARQSATATWRSKPPVASKTTTPICSASEINCLITCISLQYWRSMGLDWSSRQLQDMLETSIPANQSERSSFAILANARSWPCDACNRGARVRGVICARDHPATPHPNPLPASGAREMGKLHCVKSDHRSPQLSLHGRGQEEER